MVVLFSLIAFLAAVFFINVFFIGRYSEISDLRSEIDSKQRELDLLRDGNALYEEVCAEYRKYGTAYMTEDERLMSERRLVLEKIDEYIIANGAVMKLRLSGNELSATLFDVSLDGASDIIDAMSADGDSAIVYAAARTANNETVIASGGANGEGIRVPTVEMKVCFADGIGGESGAGE